eukprot:1869187-Prymnesium_polylepis.1
MPLGACSKRRLCDHLLRQKSGSISLALLRIRGGCCSFTSLRQPFTFNERLERALLCESWLLPPQQHHARPVWLDSPGGILCGEDADVLALPHVAHQRCRLLAFPLR